MSDNNTDPVLMFVMAEAAWGEEMGKHWAYPFFRDNLNRYTYIVSKELNEDPELFK
jgi:hypothetical protein